MHKKLTLIAGLLGLLSLPHLGYAQSYDYISSGEFFQQFANARNAESRVAAQQQISDARREAAYAALNTDTTHASAEEEPEVVTNTDSGSAYELSISAETLRALERIEQQKAENELRAQALKLLGASDFTLHSGADLSGGVTGKGATGKGTPTFLPTNSNNLSHTGSSTVLFIATLIVAVASCLVVLKKKQTAFTATTEQYLKQ